MTCFWKCSDRQEECEVVTWTFDLAALFIGMLIGIIIGAGLAQYMMLRDGGLWDIGFMEGVKCQQLHEAVNADNQKEDDVK